MRILNWNVRGLGDTDKCKLVKDAILSCRRNVVCLQETKLQAVEAAKASSFLPFSLKSFFSMPASGSAGGLLVAWDQDYVSATEIFRNQYCISVNLSSVSDNNNFCLTTVYAPCDNSERPDFFHALDQVAELVSGPWILLGDFNMYRFANEKSKGRKNWVVMDSFNDWIRENALDDIDITNRTYTWSNKRRDPTMVKLDKVLVNADWNLGFLNTEALAITATTSDHVPITVDFNRQSNRSNCFCFENHWLHIQEARNVIHSALTRGTRHFASATSLLNFKLRRTRAAIRKWTRSRSSLQLLLQNCKHVIQYLDTVEERRRLSAMEFSLRKFATAKAQQIIIWQTEAWRRRAKIRNCVLGDENNSFFHAAANYHHRKNRIRMLAKDNIEFFDDRHKLDIATDYFTTIFGQQTLSLPTIDARCVYEKVNLEALEEPFSWGEIVRAIDKSPNHRSPGPDGYTNEFYKAFKEVLKEDLLQLSQDFHHNRADFQGVNTAHIVLIPKKEAPVKVKDFRPISLVHSLPKLASKVLANRLQRLIPSLVHSLQSGFLPGRSIIENFLLAADSYNKQRRGTCP